MRAQDAAFVRRGLTSRALNLIGLGERNGQVLAVLTLDSGRT